MLGISRFEYSRARGWLVRVLWRGKRRAKLFSDGRWGGREQALDQAYAFRSRAWTALGRPRAARVLMPPPSRRTGVRVESAKAIAFIAVLPNEVRYKSYSFAKYGRRNALHLARSWRKRMERLYYGVKVV
jgi:hypothetical protein